MNMPKEVKNLDIVEKYSCSRIWKGVDLHQVADYGILKANYRKGFPVAVLCNVDADKGKGYVQIGHFSSDENDSIEITVGSTIHAYTKDSIDFNRVYVLDTLQGITVEESKSTAIDLSILPSNATEELEGHVIEATERKPFVSLQDAKDAFVEGDYLIVEADGVLEVARYDKVYDEQVIVTHLTNYKSSVITESVINGSAFYNKRTYYKIEDQASFKWRYGEYIKHYEEKHEQEIKDFYESKEKPKESTWSIDDVYNCKR